MLLDSVRYARPSSLDDAVRLMAGDAGARVLAGGQSLLNVMKLRIAAPSMLVDLNRLAELAYVRGEPNGALRIGAMTRYDDLHHSQTLRDAYPLVAEVIGHLADQQVRMRGTIGGNLCYNDPTSNLPPLAVALGASLSAIGPGGERMIPAERFFIGAYATALERGEILAAIVLPPPAGRKVGYQTLRVSPDGWGLVHAAVSFAPEAGRISDPRIVLGCVADVPTRATTMERALDGRLPDAAAIRAAAAGVATEVSPQGDSHASSGYRARMAGVIAARAVLQAVEAP